VLGDGCVFIVIRHVIESGALNFIPLLDIKQKTTEYNSHLFKMISAYLKTMQIFSALRTASREGLSSFRIEGINAFQNLLPLFIKYRHFWYFKTNQLALLVEFFKYYSAPPGRGPPDWCNKV
jgi:hypothetical protein